MPRRHPSAAAHLIGTLSCASLLTFAITVAAGPASLSNADKRTLAQMALAWAIDGGISDVKLIKDPATVIVSTANLPAKTTLTLPARTVRVLPPAGIQTEADHKGDFLYFRFGSFTGTAETARVAVSLVWAISKHSQHLYLSGGGATLSFEKHDGTWQLLPVTDRWMSSRPQRRRALRVDRRPLQTFDSRL
jgi:hypothetical protein